MSIYYARHRRRKGLETFMRWYTKPMNKLEAIAVSAVFGLILGTLIFMSVVA